MKLQTVEWIYEHINELLLILIFGICLIKGIQIAKKREPYLTFFQKLLIKYQRDKGDEVKAEKEKERLLQWNKSMGYGYIYIYGSVIVLIMIVFRLLLK
ncbi:MAG: hypothetical protein FP831_03725 [Anaerolineae bacterium]|nr:hypothetical protein [Anaerolineae bacterium]